MGKTVGKVLVALASAWALTVATVGVWQFGRAVTVFETLATAAPIVAPAVNDPATMVPVQWGSLDTQALDNLREAISDAGIDIASALYSVAGAIEGLH